MIRVRVAALTLCCTLGLGFTVPVRQVATDVQTPVRAESLSICTSADIPARVWALMSPEGREFQLAADKFTANFIKTVLGEGPYPPCLCQSVRSYLFVTTDTSAVASELARRQREDAANLLHVIVNSS